MAMAWFLCESDSWLGVTLVVAFAPLRMLETSVSETACHLNELKDDSGQQVVRYAAAGENSS